MSTVPGFDEVFDAYRAKVVRTAARMVGRDDAEDVAQEVFVKVRRSLSALEDFAKLDSWIYTITLNTARDALRRRAPEAAEPELEPADPHARTPEEIALHDEMVACYLRHVEMLPPGYREVFVMGDFSHLAGEEIARRTGLTLGTVKVRLHRARARLQQELRRNCRCYVSERGELMATPKTPGG